MKQHIKSLPHHPKRVIIISLIIAVSIGIFGYVNINKRPTANIPEDNSSKTAKNISLNFSASGKVKDVSVKVGDQVKRGDVLATLTPNNMDGSLTQAIAAYEIAKANYQKIIDGATGPTIDVAKAAVATAQTNLNEVKKQQDTLVANARRKLYSDNLVATSDNNNRRDIVPVITGVYNGEEGGQYKIFFNSVNDLYNSNVVSYSGIESGTGEKSDLPKPLGTKGLFIAFPKLDYILSDSWIIDIPNKNGSNYTGNLNAYQSALQVRDQAVASAEAALNQATAALSLTVANTRSEDVAIARAQVDNAYGILISNPGYSSTVILAPGDGSITAVNITPGQIITPDISALGFFGLTN